MSAVPDIGSYAERFPLAHLSVSSLRSYWQCPERWRRRYLEHQYEPSSGAMIAGRAFDAAETTNFGQKIEAGSDLPWEDVRDAYLEEFDQSVEEATDGAGLEWHDAKPGAVKDSGGNALKLYHAKVAPQVLPLFVQRKFAIRFEEMPWTFEGYLDLEVRPSPRRRKGAPVADLKLKGKRMSPDDARRDIQASTYLAARRAEGNPAKRFDFHVATTTKQPTVELIGTERSDEQLDAFLGRAFYAAGEIAWRLEYDAWAYAPPGSWLCSERWCGFWATCPAGGLAATAAAEVVRAG
jgi:hypothetical protein